MVEQRQAVAKRKVLESKVEIAQALQDAAEPECKGHLAAAQEEVAHLHRITQKPGSQHGEPEPLARPRPLVRNDLGHREEGFDA